MRSAESIAGPVPAVVHTFDPALTDPAITAYRGVTYSYAPVSPTNGSLLVFLPGQEATPSDYTTLSAFAASIGYHVLTIDYPNTYSPTELCNGDPTCDGSVLWQKWDGRPGVDHVTVGNSIKNRLTKAILYLNATYPAEGWGSFYASGEVQWWNTTLAGHSLGSWEAGAIAKLIQLKRVVMFAGPEDVEGNAAVAPPVVATWLAQYSPNPISRFYVFAHVQDPFYPATKADCSAMGLGSLGAWTTVDGSTPPYGGSHELTTDLPSADPHHAVAFNGSIPLGPTGVPIYADAWRYILAP